MKKSFILFVLTFTLCGLFACNTASTDKTADATEKNDAPAFDAAAAKSSVEASNVKFVEAFKKGDSAGVAALYTNDAMIMPPNMATVKGNSIPGFWGGFMRMGVKDVKLVTDDVEGNAEQLVETGRYEIFGDGNKQLDNGKYIVAWKSVNGEWKMHRDIFNSDMPPPGN
jgi:ketosteroid isomerase-like protein